MNCFRCKRKMQMSGCAGLRSFLCKIPAYPEGVVDFRFDICASCASYLLQTLVSKMAPNQVLTLINEMEKCQH